MIDFARSTITWQRVTPNALDQRMFLGWRVALIAGAIFVCATTQSTMGQADLRAARAVEGQPFGVFLVEVPLPPGMAH